MESPKIERRVCKTVGPIPSRTQPQLSWTWPVPDSHSKTPRFIRRTRHLSSPLLPFNMLMVVVRRPPAIPMAQLPSISRPSRLEGLEWHPLTQQRSYQMDKGRRWVVAGRGQGKFAALHGAVSLDRRSTDTANSPEDKDFLEAAYQENPRPGRDTRLRVVQRVSMNEKQVQVRAPSPLSTAFAPNYAFCVS